MCNKKYKIIFLLKIEKLLLIKPYKVSDFCHVDSKNSNARKIKNKDNIYKTAYGADKYNETDFIGARKCINGRDRAKEISKIAEKYLSNF